MPDLKGAFLRVERADERLTEFVALQASHRLDQYSSVTVYKHPQSGYYVPQAVYSGPPLGPNFAIVLGEIVYNLRSALDYLIYELAYLDSGQIQEKTQFPIEGKPELFNSKRPGLLKGVNDEHAAYIEVLQPYRGSYWTQVLRDISNPDKHRQLTVVRGGGSGNFRVVYGPKGSFDGLLGTILQAPDDPTIDVYVDGNHSFDVALENGRAIEYVVQDMSAGVLRTLKEFEPCFAGECQHTPPDDWK